MNEKAGLHITLAAERLGTLWGVPITNTLVTQWLVMGFLVLIAVVVGKNPTLIPGKVQNFFEMLFDFVIDYMQNILGSRALAERFFPLIATIFLFICASNLFDFLPFFGSVVFHPAGSPPAGGVPLFRPVNTDLNITLALAIISVLSIEVSGIIAVGFWRYGSKFFNFSSPLNFIVGIIEFVSEMSRFISFSFRLFGNIFAGEVLLAVVAYFMPYVLPVPLMAFETFVGVVQAGVFAMLTLFFIKLAIAMPHSVAHNEAHGSGSHAVVE
ncbi:MAG: F0F1 ATP synthase subunit A [bacterium]